MYIYSIVNPPLILESIYFQDSSLPSPLLAPVTH